jgi:hypothetical protein
MEVDLSTPGARAEYAMLQELQALLNREAIVPERAYRMSMVVYSLVCFVNNTIGLCLSGNLEVVPIFIARAHVHMVEHPPTPALERYYDVVSRYLRQLTHVLKMSTSITQESLQCIPAEILEAGSQVVPSGNAGT